MVVFPNAKINLGLNILSKREDGYHNISSCFLPIGWKDALEAIPAETFAFESSGLSIPGGWDTNLCVKAYKLLNARHAIPPVKMHLHKAIPMGAGLGGGSSDGAFALKLLNDLFKIGLTTNELEMYAKELGADCPFFVQNTPKLVSETGDVLNDVNIDLSGLGLVVVYPNVHVDTKKEFSQISPKVPEVEISHILDRPVDLWKDQLVNDFEAPVCGQFPEIQEIKNNLYVHEAIYASMTGSGSAVFGFFKSPQEARLVKHHFSKYIVFSNS